MKSLSDILAPCHGLSDLAPSTMAWWNAVDYMIETWAHALVEEGPSWFPKPTLKKVFKVACVSRSDGFNQYSGVIVTAPKGRLCSWWSTFRRVCLFTESFRAYLHRVGFPSKDHTCSRFLNFPQSSFITQRRCHVKPLGTRPQKKRAPFFNWWEKLVVWLDYITAH